MVQSNDGSVTVFFVLKDGNSFINLESSFLTNALKGLSKQITKLHSILVANNDNQLMERYSDEINSSIRWI